MRTQGVSSSSCWKYDVFLSFRGEDTRKNFTDHLYAALNQAGINVFRDDKELERGKEISTELINAIEQSRFSVVVFSRNYASSTWCLDELVKIVECKNTRGQKVIPIFYDVDPSTVRKQSHNFHIEKVPKWKTALIEVANLSGWDAKERHESELVEQIVKEISSTLNHSRHRNNFAGLVGLDSRLEKLKMLIGAGSDDVRMIGICGMGGIGKTTIARAIFESISSEFGGSSFVANVREISEKYDLVYLQKQLLSQILKGINIDICTAYDGINMIKNRLQNIKVLIVLDDVVHAEQLNNLVERCEWFGSGSRIIITTRDQHLLKTHRVHEIYMVEKLNDDEAYQLFSLKAFKDQAPRDYVHLSKRVVQYADGLPLALKVLGSHLFGRTIDAWRSALERLDRDPENEILDILHISFDGLKETEKKIFLDIACFFIGKDKDYVTRIMDGCDFHCGIGMDVLIDKCLITISKSNELWMHDLLQDMGHQIVNKESPKPGNRSRLWKEQDIKDVLTKNTGTDAVEAIMSETALNLSISAKAFLKMTNLRLLKIKNVQLPAEGLEYLSDQLRVLIWHGYSLKSLPSSVQPDQIVELELRLSPIEQLWKRTTHLNMLTSIRLEDCSNLIEIPNLTWAPNLVELFIQRCPRLLGIHSPLLVHKKLIYLKVHDCTSLMTLPGMIHMESLKSFWVSGCPKLKKFPEIARRMKHLWSLEFKGTAVREMPSSIELLSGLEELDLSDNSSFDSLILSAGCSYLSSFLPSTINSLVSLYRPDHKSFHKGFSNLVTLPDTINSLISLRSLNLSGCSNLVTLPDTINGLISLKNLSLSRCSNLVTLPDTINGLISLKFLNLSGCFNLVTLPDTINSLISLQYLNLSSCSNLLTLPNTINGLISLEYLNLHRCSRLVTLPYTINGLRSLYFLELSNCSNIVTLPDTIYGLESLEYVDLSDCDNLVALQETINCLTYLNPSAFIVCERYKDLHSCTELENLQASLGEAASLKEHILSGFEFKGIFGLEGVEVERCGIHPINEQDLSDFNPAASQPIVNVATTYGNLPDHDDEEPQPKRYKNSSS